MDFKFFENDIFYQIFNMNLNKIVWRIFLNTFSRIFQEYFLNISPKAVTKAIKN
jgi:hypothetical protein